MTVGSVLFVGVVIDSGVVPATGAEAPHDVHFRVDEVFEGLAPGIKEVAVTAGGSWLIKGNSYLIDARRGDDGRLYLAICGTSGEVTETTVKNVLEFLRQRPAGEI